MDLTSNSENHHLSHMAHNTTSACITLDLSWHRTVTWRVGCMKLCHAFETCRLICKEIQIRMIYSQINHGIKMKHFLIKTCLILIILSFSESDFIDKCREKDLCKGKVTNFNIKCCESENFCMFCLIILGKGTLQFEKNSVQARKNPLTSLRYAIEIK